MAAKLQETIGEKDNEEVALPPIENIKPDGDIVEVDFAINPVDPAVVPSCLTPIFGRSGGKLLLYCTQCIIGSAALHPRLSSVINTLFVAQARSARKHGLRGSLTSDECFTEPILYGRILGSRRRDVHAERRRIFRYPNLPAPGDEPSKTIGRYPVAALYLL